MIHMENALLRRMLAFCRCDTYAHSTSHENSKPHSWCAKAIVFSMLKFTQILMSFWECFRSLHNQDSGLSRSMVMVKSWMAFPLTQWAASHRPLSLHPGLSYFWNFPRDLGSNPCPGKLASVCMRISHRIRALLSSPWFIGTTAVQW